MRYNLVKRVDGVITEVQCVLGSWEKLNDLGEYPNIPLRYPDNYITFRVGEWVSVDDFVKETNI